MKKTIVICVLMILLLNISVFAENNHFSISFPDYYEKISDYEWLTTKYLINDNATTVHATVSFDDSSMSGEMFFSQDNLSRLEEEIASSDGFEQFKDEPEEIVTAVGKYRCVYTSYACDINNEKYSVVTYAFYSDSQICTIKFVADSPLFVLPGGRDIVDTVSFTDDFYVLRETTEDSSLEHLDDTVKRAPKKDSDVDWLLIIVLIIGFLFMALTFYWIGESIFWCFDHGKWENNAIPDINATIVDFSSKQESYGRNNMKYKTTVTFSDGYKFTTTKTKREDKFLTYRISIDSQLRDEIIARAITSHQKAIEKIQAR